jgi:hypothetical protein
MQFFCECSAIFAMPECNRWLSCHDHHGGVQQVAALQCSSLVQVYHRSQHQPAVARGSDCRSFDWKDSKVTVAQPDNRRICFRPPRLPIPDSQRTVTVTVQVAGQTASETRRFKLNRQSRLRLGQEACDTVSTQPPDRMSGLRRAWLWLGGRESGDC